MWLLLIAAAAMAVLVRGADWLVEGASGAAYRMGLPKVIVGATIVSLGTTSPECAVSVMAAWGGDAGLALGNAVGSVIADTALIFGVGAMLVALPADRFVLNRQGWVQISAGCLLAGLCYLSFAMDGDGAAIGRWVGVLFLVLLVGYMAVSVRWARQHIAGEPFQTPDDVAGAIPLTPKPESKAAPRSMLFLVMRILMGLTIVVFASHVLILSVSELAQQMGVPNVVIAATLVAFGTSLPELVVGVMSIRKGHPELLVGNVIGADILNVLFVIGASATAAELPIVEGAGGDFASRIFLYLHLPTMLIVLVAFRVMMFGAIGRGRFSRVWGAPLVVIYIVYTVASFLMSRPM